MKRNKILLSVFAAAALISGGIMYAADHIDAPAVTNQTTDITDLYVFQGQTATNMVFVANVQGLLSPGSTGAAKFDANSIIEFNIDNTGDYKEDLVIQCKYNATTNTMDVYGPIVPSETGTRSKLEGNVSVSVAVTPYGSTAITATGGSGITAFAGPRDDPFFFDFTQYGKIIAGTATGFLPAGSGPGFASDTFAGSNVLSTVVEVPKAMLGSAAVLNVWVETKKKI